MSPPPNRLSWIQGLCDVWQSFWWRFTWNYQKKEKNTFYVLTNLVICLYSSTNYILTKNFLDKTVYMVYIMMCFQSFWRGSCPDLSPCRASVDHCLRRPHPQAVESAKNCTGEKVSASTKQVIFFCFIHWKQFCVLKFFAFTDLCLVFTNGNNLIFQTLNQLYSIVLA